MCGFWPGQFKEISYNLLLIPDTIVCSRTRCTAPKQLAIFVMLRRWKKADKWEDVARLMRRGRVWCINIYRQIFSLISQHYRRLVQVLDYHRIIPLLEEWSDTMVLFSGCCGDVLFFTDGKPWKRRNLGKEIPLMHLFELLVEMMQICSSRPITIVTVDFLVQKCSMCCKPMACVTPSHVH